MRARDLETTCTSGQFAAKLRRLARAVEANRSFTIKVAGKRVYVPRHAVLSIEQECEGKENELEFQLRWSSGKPARHLE